MDAYKKMIQKVMAGFLMAALMVGILTTVSGSEAKAADDSVTAYTVPEISSTEELNSISAMYTTHASVESGADAEYSYFQFSVNEESWVYFTGSMSNNKHNGGQIHVNIYSDAAMTNPVGEYGWGYWESTKEFAGILAKGTYYARVSVKFANYDSPFESDINVIAGAIPTSKLIDPKVSVAKNQAKATVTFADVLGSMAKDVQYREGNISKIYNESSSYWKKSISSGLYTGAKDAYILQLEGDSYSFTVKKNGAYTILVSDNYGNYYSTVVKINGVDDKAPAVSGVKDGKVYKKAVTIRFSDQKSGIKKAVLNGKAIKSGTKVSKNGKYTLKVTDNAGNVKTIKFQLK
jgi:hypothetical protein